MPEAPLEQLEHDLKRLRQDMDAAFSGSPRDRQSQKDSVYGRLDALEDDVAQIKKGLLSSAEKSKEDAGRMEKYRAGFILAILGSAGAWVFTRLTGGN